MGESSIDSEFSGSKSSISSESSSMMSKESSVMSSISGQEKLVLPNTNNVGQVGMSSSEYLSTSHNSLNKSWAAGSNSSLNFSNSNLHTLSHSNTNNYLANSDELKNTSLNKLSKKSEKDSTSDDEDDDIEGFDNVSVMNNIKSDQVNYIIYNINKCILYIYILYINH